MPGEPAETLVGVGAVGFGILLLYSAFRNVPLFGADGLLTNVVVKGKFPGPTMLGKQVFSPDVNKALSDIGGKDPALSADIRAEIVVIRLSSDRLVTKHFTDLMNKAIALGFQSQVIVLTEYAAGLHSTPGVMT